jgi:hypothetical protein
VNVSRKGDPGATGRLSRITGVTWRWRAGAPDDAKVQPGMGVIAQDVEAVFPELVTTDEQGRKKVDYAGLVGPVIEAIKELDARLTAVEQRLDERDRA